jgi:hypothetical protein
MVKVVEDRLVKVGVGSIVENQSGRIETLRACEWEGAEFRYPHAFQPNPAVAVNVEITGRTFQLRGSVWAVKVRLEWVGDGEPSRFSTGWLRVSPHDCVRASEVA